MRRLSIIAAHTDTVRLSWAGAAPLTSLRRRGREQAELSLVMQEVRSARGGVLVVRSEAGAGKTALLDDYSTAVTRVAVLPLVAVGVLATLALARVFLVAPATDRGHRL